MSPGFKTEIMLTFFSFNYFSTCPFTFMYKNIESGSPPEEETIR